ncbi:MAG: RHS repeat-associated core domain-containing protein [Acidobacteriota bacterium]
MIPAADHECCPIARGAGASCVSHPIRLANGNMRYVDRDPLPGDFSGEFSRTYDSANAEAGVFGVHWTSAFDAWLRVAGDTVVIGTERNHRAVFEAQTGGFVQLWPTGGTARGSLTQATDGSYLYREAGGDLVRTFRSDGRLIAIRRLSTSREAVISYAANGLPVQVADANGTWAWTIGTDATTYRVQTIAVVGRSDIVWTYNYDGGGNLTSVAAPDGQPWRTYVYAGTSMTEARDAAGRIIETHTYDTNGKALTSIGADNSATDVQYGLPGRNADEKVTQVTSSTGKVSRYYERYIGGRPMTVQVDGGCSSCGTDDAVYSYDDEGHLLREQDARGYITAREYDGSPSPSVVSGPWRPAGCDPETDAARCRLTPETIAATDLSATTATQTGHYVYGDSRWPDRVTSISTDSVLSPGASRTETYSYDGATGATLSHAISGWTSTPPHLETRLTSTSLYNGTEGAAFDPCGGASGCAFNSAWLTLAQPVGLPKSVDGPRNDVVDVTSLVYYPVAAAVAATDRGRLAATRDAVGHIARYEAYDVFGNATKVIDANGVVTERVYDAFGRLQTSTLKGVAGCDTSADPLCATDLVSAMTYAPGGGPLSTSTRPGGGSVTYEYDAFGRTSSVTRNVTPSSSLRERLESDYDPATGQKSAERTLTNASGSYVTKRSESYTYDSSARLIQVTHADSTRVLTDYDGSGNVTATTDENHATPNTRYKYDAAGRLIELRQTLTASAVVTSYAYDPQGNLVSVTDPNGNMTSYTYDDFALLQHQTSPVTGVTTYSYDAAGNLLSTTDANGATTTRTYDAANRVLAAVSTKPSQTAETVTWAYDDGTVGRYGRGRLVMMTDPTGSTTYAYERRGLERSEAKTVLSTTYTATFAYDADGNRVKMGYPSGRDVLYTYDLTGRPRSAASGTTSFVSSAGYLPFGPLTDLAFGNGTAQTMTYNSRFLPVENKLTSGASTLADYTYAEDAVGNITQIHDAIDPTYNRDFGYDDLNRLTTANTGSSLWGLGSYSYDAMGNMLTTQLGTARSATFSYLGSTPKLTAAVENGVSRAAAYDPAGNETSVGASLFTVSPRNQVATGDGAGYSYDGRGVRITTSVGSTSRLSLYTPELNLMSESESAASLAYDYIWFGGKPVAQVDVAASTTHWTFADHLGTPVLQTDASGTIDWRAEYEPFGSIYTLRTGTTRHQPLRFPGQEADPANGEREYNIFRWYRSGWGRYTQSDPIGLKGGINSFSYARNPLTQVDPLGLSLSQKQLDDMSCCELLKTLRRISGEIDEVKRQTAYDVENTHGGMMPAAMITAYIGHYIKYVQYRRSLRKALKSYDDRCPPGQPAAAIRKNVAVDDAYPPPLDSFWKAWRENLGQNNSGLPPLIDGVPEGVWVFEF